MTGEIVDLGGAKQRAIDGVGVEVARPGYLSPPQFLAVSLGETVFHAGPELKGKEGANASPGAG